MSNIRKALERRIGYKQADHSGGDICSCYQCEDERDLFIDECCLAWELALAVFSDTDINFNTIHGSAQRFLIACADAWRASK